MKKIIVELKNNSFLINASENNTSIINSYKIKSIKDMKEILNTIRLEVTNSNMAINKRRLYSMINEWRAHNLLYSFGIQRDRTKTVDLDINQPWYMKIIYPIFSLFYFRF